MYMCVYHAWVPVNAFRAQYPIRVDGWRLDAGVNENTLPHPFRSPLSPKLCSTEHAAQSELWPTPSCTDFFLFVVMQI